MKNVKTYCNPLSIEDIPSGRWLDTSLTKEDPRSIKDYRSISDPSVVYHNGKWIMYPSYSVAYITEDFVNWKHVDIGIPHLRYSPAVVCFRGKWYLSGHGMSEVYVADGPSRPLYFMRSSDRYEWQPDGCGGWLLFGRRRPRVFLLARKPNGGGRGAGCRGDNGYTWRRA